MEDQPKFLRDKADKLKHIMAEEKDLGLEPTVFQVSWLVGWLIDWLVGKISKFCMNLRILKIC